MEHRLSARAPLNTSVAIYYKSLGLLQGQAVDVSRHGIFIRTGHMVLPLHALVEVVFPPGDATGRAGRTPAMVVRIAPHGIGLMFGSEVELAAMADGEAPEAEIIDQQPQLRVC